ncbi:nad fad-binding protein [Leptolyngbya sp. Heron Island J]|uniref:FAD-dependent oxidoreductase n=1 Tax=Leptolyngbya sp. Heron Island J TaxID=1385935 RepID=UPI0003B95EEA|nr:FAD-dependent oxidoreductase [Leptolyngbya sp. Heron Island J]ESA34448.1 nad fad-binding protein [Leptolyngbya sp. Heron Island J]
MKIAIIGGGASGMVTAYLLDQQGHHVTVFEKQPMLGGHIRTLNKNVMPNHSDCNQVLENGVLEFPDAFHNFLALMQQLNVELEPVDIGSGLFFPDGHHILSGAMIRRNFRGLQRLVEYLRLDTLYARSAGFWVRMQFPDMRDFYDQSMGQHLGRDCERNTWLKLLTMYSYSTPYDKIDNFPAELAIPALRQYIFVRWFRIRGGVYGYIEKILEQFRGKIVLNALVKSIARTPDGITLELADGQQDFDKVVFATPPDQVMPLLADPTPSETRRFQLWQPNYVRTFLHADTSMYKPYGITQPSEFDFFKTNQGWGYNAFLNQLCDVKSGQCYSLAFNLANLIDKDKIIHIQEHHTPLFTTESFHYRDEIVETNGENNTYHAGAYLGDGLHEGAVTSAMGVAQLMR